MYATCKRWLGWAFLVGALGLLAGCRVELFGRLNEADANAVLDALYSEGITADKVVRDRELWGIEVAEGDLQRALRVTQDRGVPRERFATMGDLFKKEGLVSSPSEERLRYIFAVSQELSNTLTQIDGVVTARVHPVIPANDPLADRVKPSSASVFIKHHAQADVQQMAPAIRNMVARSIEGLNPDNVSLTFFSAPPARAVPPSPTGWAGFGRGWWGEALVVGLLAAAAFASWRWRVSRAPAANLDLQTLPSLRSWWGGNRSNSNGKIVNGPGHQGSPQRSASEKILTSEPLSGSGA